MYESMSPSHGHVLSRGAIIHGRNPSSGPFFAPALPFISLPPAPLTAGLAVHAASAALLRDRRQAMTRATRARARRVEDGTSSDSKVVAAAMIAILRKTVASRRLLRAADAPSRLLPSLCLARDLLDPSLQLSRRSLCRIDQGHRNAVVVRHMLSRGDGGQSRDVDSSKSKAGSR